jgi:hypothetical protein
VGNAERFASGQQQPLISTVTTSAPIATFDVVKLFHRTLADAREMIAQTFLVAVDQSRE